MRNIPRGEGSLRERDPLTSPSPRPLSSLSARPMRNDVRRCGTPGCTLPDFHKGPCEGQTPLGSRPKPSNFSERKKDQVRPCDTKEKRPKRPKQESPAVAAEPPPEQYVHPSGLARFYHTHRWGVPLPLGPVAEDADSDEELDESWRLSETEERLGALR